MGGPDDANTRHLHRWSEERLRMELSAFYRSDHSLLPELTVALIRADQGWRGVAGRRSNADLNQRPMPRGSLNGLHDEVEMPMNNAALPVTDVRACRFGLEYMMDRPAQCPVYGRQRRRGDQYREHVAQTAPHVL